MLNAALIGLGWWGRHIARTLAANDKIRVVHAVDVQPSGADFASELGLRFSTELQDALDDQAIGAVIVATPHSTHEDLVLRAARAGKHVFCEKPLALTHAAAVACMTAAEQAGVQLGVGHERRFELAWLEIARMVEAGELGTILHAEANFSHDKLAHVAPGDWRASSAESPAAGMTSMGIHLTDIFIALFGDIKRVHAETAGRVLKGENGDVVTAQFKFRSGQTASMGALLATPLYIRLCVFGSEAWVEARNTSHPDTPAPISLTLCRKGGAPETRTLDWVDTVSANFEAFADACEGRAPYPFSNHQLVHNIAVLEAVIKSAGSGQTVTVA